MIILPHPVEFLWDKGNIDKNLVKHKVTNSECEEAFFDDNKVILKDVLHSTNKEPRYILIGATKKKRLIFIAFTVRAKKIRIISARDLNKKEKYFYEKDN